MAVRKAKTKRKSTKGRPAIKRKTTSTKRTAARGASAKGKAVKRAAGPVSVGRKPFSKSQLIATICEQTSLVRKDVVAVLESISAVIAAHVRKGGPEIFSWPGLMKIQVVRKPATKARKGVNPFTGETMMFKAKPASRRVKIRPLKQLKEMAV